MDDKNFNLTTEPWIKVITLDDNQEQTVSLIDLFENAHRYRQLAGDMRSQDLAILRLLLAILTTVYSRFDADGQLYKWLEINEKSEVSIDTDEFDEDDSEDDLFKTWQNLSQAGQLSPVATQYLKTHADEFDFFGPHPFYQVTAEDYDALVPEAKRVAGGKGQVGIKQLNRQVSESGNTPAIFAPKAGETKNNLPLDELVRWIISYQNFTGVTDKSKVVTDEKFSNSAGWIYRINPVFAKGKSLFETLLLNLILVNEWQDEIEYTLPKPVWEYKSVRDYVTHRKAQLLPDNLAELYTTWSRILHIEWDETDSPHIFSAGIPIFDYEDALIEPMTTWRFDRKEHAYRPAVKGLRSLGIAMWRNFGQYVKVRSSDDVHEPGIVVWLHKLKKRKLIPREDSLILNSVALISDGVATSQSPAAEVVDDMQLQADVLFPSDDQNEPMKRWPTWIEDTIALTQTIGTDYFHFASDIGKIRNLDVRPFASGMSAKFYEQLNEPFKEWLENLESGDNRDKRVNQWKQTLQRIVVASVNDVMQASSPRDVKGISTDHGPLNIFTAKNRLMGSVQKHLELKKE